MSKNGEIYTTGKNFTLPPALTAWPIPPLRQGYLKWNHTKETVDSLSIYTFLCIARAPKYECFCSDEIKMKMKPRLQRVSAVWVVVVEAPVRRCWRHAGQGVRRGGDGRFSAFKTWIRMEETIAIFNFLIENVTEYEIAGRACNRCQTRMFVFLHCVL